MGVEAESELAAREQRIYSELPVPKAVALLTALIPVVRLFHGEGLGEELIHQGSPDS